MSGNRFTCPKCGQNIVLFVKPSAAPTCTGSGEWPRRKHRKVLMVAGGDK